MYQYIWDEETGGPLLITEISKFSKEPRPVYYRELDILGFDKYWNYPKDDRAPLMWAEANNYIYFGRTVAKTKGGSLYTVPELILLEDPEPDGGELRFVDIERMVEKNAEIMETLTQETIKKLYNTYRRLKNKVDSFHVSFSGGKDSVVAFDIVQRAIPHDEIKVIFGDTGMEFPDTYDVIKQTEEKCKAGNISFEIAKSHFNPLDTWERFGEPSSALRWCCSVHKTTPQLLLMRSQYQKDSIKDVSLVGVRGDESVRRGKYAYISVGEKQKGQYSCNPILDWNSIEVFLYQYINNIPLHKAYKMGSARVGCLFCPMSTNRSDFINFTMYPNEVQPYIDIIKKLNSSEPTEERFFSYINNKAWKARKNGRDLKICFSDYYEEKIKGLYCIHFKDDNKTINEWMKTVGEFDVVGDQYQIRYENSTYIFTVEKEGDAYCLSINEKITQEDKKFFKALKNVVKKCHGCVGCRTCEVNCPHGNISFDGERVSVSDKCIHCGQCNELDHGCLRFKSLWLSKGAENMDSKSIDSYGTHAPKQEWIDQFVKYKEDFFTEHTLGKVEIPMFRKFLRDCGLLGNKNEFNDLTKKFFDLPQSEVLWAIIFTNLSYSPEIGWLVRHLDFDVEYRQTEIRDELKNYTASKTGPQNIANSYRRISLLPINDLGFGNSFKAETKEDKFVIIRKSWSTPDPRVILYSLYKFAENCGDYYQFSLSTLLDDTIERDGISPTRIFGLDRETMVPMLNGLSVNYSEFINASFTLGLDTINLRPDKTSEDVLSLF